MNNEQLQEAIEIGTYLFNLNSVNYENHSIEELQSQFIRITNEVKQAIEVFLAYSSLSPQTKDQVFVVMTSNLIRLYLFYFNKCYGNEPNVPTDAKECLKSLVNRLEELNYEKLKNNFEL